MICYTAKHHIPFLIDDEQWSMVRLFTWRYDRYIKNHAVGLLHVYLFGEAPVAREWDHINRCEWDNRQANLRIVTLSANRRNRNLFSNNRSGHRGISLRKNGSWQVEVKVDGKRNYLGSYQQLTEAIKVQQAFIQSVFGD